MMVNHTDWLSIDEILHYADVGLLDSEHNDLLVQVYEETENEVEEQIELAYNRGCEEDYLELTDEEICTS